MLHDWGLEITHDPQGPSEGEHPSTHPFGKVGKTVKEPDYEQLANVIIKEAIHIYCRKKKQSFPVSRIKIYGVYINKNEGIFLCMTELLQSSPQMVAALWNMGFKARFTRQSASAHEGFIFSRITCELQGDNRKIYAINHYCQSVCLRCLLSPRHLLIVQLTALVIREEK